jgi:hypothetical protein
MTSKPKSHLIHDKLAEEPEPLLLPGEVRPVPLEDRVLLHPGEQDLDAVRPVVAEWDACQQSIPIRYEYVRGGALWFSFLLIRYLGYLVTTQPFFILH